MTKRNKITRKGTEHTVFGKADALPAHKLPLNGEVLRNCWRYKCEAGRFADVTEIVKKAALDVSAIWAKAIRDRLSIPFLDQKTTENKLKRLYKKSLLVNKNKRNLVKLTSLKWKWVNSLTFVVARVDLPLISKCTAKQRTVMDSTWLVSVM